MDNENVIVLMDEEGNEVELEVLDEIEYEGKKYGVFISTDENADEVIILEIAEGSEGEAEFLSVDDEAALEAVFAIFMENAKDEFDFVE
ncbi:MAG: DUF1292 domain-containing protein [Clostridia bacterium]|nr:DUF1292 domain-containing protein [Clostridia bacterium]